MEERSKSFTFDKTLGPPGCSKKILVRAVKFRGISSKKKIYFSCVLQKKEKTKKTPKKKASLLRTLSQIGRGSRFEKPNTARGLFTGGKYRRMRGDGGSAEERKEKKKIKKNKKKILKKNFLKKASLQQG